MSWVIVLFYSVLYCIAGILGIWLIINRIREKKKENFEQRKN